MTSRGHRDAPAASETVVVVGCVVFFLVAPLAIYIFVRPGQYRLVDLGQAVLLGLIPCAYAVARVLSTPPRITQPFFQPVVPFAFVVLLALCLVALLAIPSLDDLRISREYERVESLPMRVLNLHLVATFLAASAAFYRRQIGAAAISGLTLAAALSLAVSVAEGRRTAAILPVAIIGLLWLSTASTAAARARRALLTFVAGILTFQLVTAVRVPSGIDTLTAARAITGRVFNTGATALEVMSSNDASYEARLLPQVASRVRYAFGLGEYHSRTNEFGIHFGFLAPTNAAVGINPGVVLELFLQSRWLFLVGFVGLFETALFLIRVFRSLVFGTDIAVALLTVHAFQMEVPYTVGLLARLTAIAIPALAARWLVLQLMTTRTARARADLLGEARA